MTCKWLPGEHRLVSCTGKIAYDSPNAAAKARERMLRKKNSERGGNVSLYRCQYCAGWHIGRKAKALRQK